MKLPFDKVYCLHLAEDKERYEHCIKEFERIGITEQVEFWWTCKRNISNYIGNNIQSLKNKYYEGLFPTNQNLYGNVFNCSFEHYTIIKQAYVRGFNSILIMEDDIKFIDDVDLIQEVMNNLPNNYCCIKFHTTGQLNRSYKSSCLKYEFIKKNFKKKAHSTLCYCLDRNGMKKYIDSVNTSMKCADIVFKDFLDDIYTVDNNICFPKGFISSINYR